MTARGDEHRIADIIDAAAKLSERLQVPCPPNIDSLDAMQEANILFLELIKDPSVEDPLLALAVALPAVLKAKAAGGEGSYHR